MKSGIYTITCTSNGKIYVGSSVRLERRLSEHLTNLRYGNHKNLHLQSAFNAYGENNFLFEILEECDFIYLNSLENYWCNLLNSYDNNSGYNVRPVHPDGNHAVSAISKLRMKLSRSNFKPTTSQIKKRVEKVKLPVLQFTLQDILVSRYDSARDAEYLISVDASAIGKCCKNQRWFNTAGGYKWKYE